MNADEMKSDENATGLERLNMGGIGADEGGWVKTLEGNTGTGFEEGWHVHKDWFANTTTFDQVLETIEKANSERQDHLVTLDGVTALVIGTEKPEFAIKIGDQVFVPTDHALEQMSTKFKLGSSSVLREMRKTPDFDQEDAETMAKMLNNAMRKVERNKLHRFRTYSNGTLRACVSERYAVVNNRWFIEVLREFIPDGRFTHWDRSDEDTIYGNLLIPDTFIDYSQSDDSDYGAMLSLGNCEIGTRRVGLYPSIFRSICMNGCIWGSKSGADINRRHVGDIDLTALKINIAKNIEYQLPLMDDGIRKFLKTADALYSVGGIPLQNIVTVISSSFKLGKDEARKTLSAWVEAESQHLSLFGLINSITRAGQKCSNEEWVRMDTCGGELSNYSIQDWKNTLAKAALVSDKDLEKLLGTELSK